MEPYVARGNAFASLHPCTTFQDRREFLEKFSAASYPECGGSASLRDNRRHTHESRDMIEFTLPAMSCGHCVQAITRALQAIDPLAQIRVELDSRHVSVESARDAAEFARALDEAGYPPDPA